MIFTTSFIRHLFVISAVLFLQNSIYAQTVVTQNSIKISETLNSKYWINLKEKGFLLYGLNQRKNKISIYHLDTNMKLLKTYLYDGNQELRIYDDCYAEDFNKVYLLFKIRKNKHCLLTIDVINLKLHITEFKSPNGVQYLNDNIAYVNKSIWFFGADRNYQSHPYKLNSETGLTTPLTFNIFKGKYDINDFYRLENGEFAMTYSEGSNNDPTFNVSILNPEGEVIYKNIFSHQKTDTRNKIYSAKITFIKAGEYAISGKSRKFGKKEETNFRFFGYFRNGKIDFLNFIEISDFTKLEKFKEVDSKDRDRLPQLDVALKAEKIRGFTRGSNNFSLSEFYAMYTPNGCLFYSIGNYDLYLSAYHEVASNSAESNYALFLKGNWPVEVVVIYFDSSGKKINELCAPINFHYIMQTKSPHSIDYTRNMLSISDSIGQTLIYTTHQSVKSIELDVNSLEYYESEIELNDNDDSWETIATYPWFENYSLIIQSREVENSSNNGTGLKEVKFSKVNISY